MKRSALTLVELLVVIVIMLILTSVAIPIIAPNGEQRKIREAARLVNGFLGSARAKAMETGRPVGVRFERLAGNQNASLVLTYVAVPPPYAGELTSSTCAIYWDDNFSPPRLRANVDPDATGSFNESLIRVGDTLRANFMGHTYLITGPETSATDPTIAAGTTILQLQPIPSTAMTPWRHSIDDGVTTNDPIPLPVPRVPYQITRQPIKGMGTPLQLPEGAVVDMANSGAGVNGFTFRQNTTTPNDSVVLMFGSNGMVDTIRFGSAGGSSTPLSSVHLMIGRSDGVGTKDNDFQLPDVLWNLRDPSVLWVSVNRSNGQVSTAEAGVVTVTKTPPIPDPPDASYTEALEQSRAIATGFQSMGGR